VSIADRDKALLPRLASALATAGYRLAATPGTREALEAAGYAARSVAKLGEEPDLARDEVPILELIASGEVRLVVNTPTPRSGAVRDAAEIRHAATAEGILCLTAIETAVAAAEALDPAIAGRLADVRSLDEWVPRKVVVAV
jgi:carbamoyl-phosphate synthase large subunit